MSETSPVGIDSASEGRQSAGRARLVWILLPAFFVLWLDLISQLGHTWSASDQYAYGWFVPVLSLGILVRNWTVRPAPVPGETPAWFACLVVFAGLALVPIRIVHEVNFDWSTFTWPLALGVVGLSLVSVYWIGGWAWVRHFAFPICFILIAVQWPYRLERAITHGLMQIVAAVGVEVLGWLDIPALQRGNLIEIDAGVLGIDEACSGIRSFMTALMAALFMGEHHRLGASRRFLLLAWGIFIAFVMNIFRAVFLSWNAAHHGMEAVDKWHDPAGLVIVVACFGGLWGISAWMASGRPSGSSEKGSHEAEMRMGPIPGVPLPTWRLWGLAFLVLGIPVLNAVWYRAHAARQPRPLRWTVAYPTNAFGFLEPGVPARAKAELAYDHEKTGSWEIGPARELKVFWFRWDPHSATQLLKVRQNRPEACLPGAGWKLVENAGIETFEVPGLSLPFRRYAFEFGGTTLHVFFCLWEDGAERQHGSMTKYRERLRLAWEGRRILGQQTTELMLSGFDSLDSATLAVREVLPQLVRIEGTP